jgi:hypothetical protein
MTDTRVTAAKLTQTSQLSLIAVTPRPWQPPPTTTQHTVPFQRQRLA